MPWIGSAISAGGSLLGGLLSSNSSNQAAEMQAQATREAVAEQRRQYEQTRTDQAPWRTAGSGAVNRLAYLLGIGDPSGMSAGTPGTPGRWADYVGDGGAPPDLNSPDWIPGTAGTPGVRIGDPAEFGSLNRKFSLADFWDDPVTKASYQMGLDQGKKAIGNMAGARGGRNSGATLKALTRFGTDYIGGQAAGSQARYVNDQNNTYNRYAGVSGTGQVANQSVINSGTNAANNISNLVSGLGNARGASAIASGNAWNGAINGVTNAFNQGSMLNRILSGGGNGWTGLGASGGFIDNPNDYNLNYG